jgi:hypothetical protein
MDASCAKILPQYIVSPWRRIPCLPETDCVFTQIEHMDDRQLAESYKQKEEEYKPLVRLAYWVERAWKAATSKADPWQQQVSAGWRLD